MSVDYDVALAVGFRIPAKVLEERFAVRTPAETHEEPRFDRRTGAPTAPEVVVDREGAVVYRLDGVDHEDLEDLTSALAGKLGCGVASCGSSWNGGDVAYVFGPPLELDDAEAVEDGQFSCSGGASYRALTDMAFDLHRLAGALLRLEVEPGEPRVVPVWYIS